MVLVANCPLIAVHDLRELLLILDLHHIAWRALSRADGSGKLPELNQLRFRLGGPVLPSEAGDRRLTGMRFAAGVSGRDTSNRIRFVHATQLRRGLGESKPSAR